MNFSVFDWSIVAAFLIGLALVAWYANRYTKSVADFLAANRCAGRYLLTIAQGAAGLAVINTIANFEKFYKAGFAIGWWGQMLAPIALVLALTGFVAYRYRQTKALTTAQFIEIRYSRKLRVFAGMLAFVSGIINYGIFPAVTARFFIFFCGIPRYSSVVFGHEINWTLGAVMAFLLGIALCFTLSGGQIAIMITDFIQGQFMNLTFLAVMAILLFNINWSDIISTLEQAPKGKSMLNPFDTSQVQDFNLWFFIMLGILRVYQYRVWGGGTGYNAAAKSAHEAKMAGILGAWRSGVTYLLIMLLPICAYVILHSDLFPAKAHAANQVLDGIHHAQTLKQVRVSVVLIQMLPTGVLGLFAAVMLAASISTDDTYLHQWGSIFIQDVVVPLRKTHISPKTHMLLLRVSIFGVAVFAWCFGMFFSLEDYIFMFFQITGAIFLGGAGAVVIGGLYWKRGTTAGAWTAFIVGMTLATVSICLQYFVWPNLASVKAAMPDIQWVQRLPAKFPLNGMQSSFITAIIACTSYVLVSLVTKVKPEFSMDKMLHRGEYADPSDAPVKKAKKRSWLEVRFGITDEFTRGDKIIYWLKIGWTMLLFSFFVVISIWNLIWLWPDRWWANWWLFKICLAGTIGVICVIWFTIGGIFDIFDLFRTLSSKVRDNTDDGMVEEAPPSGIDAVTDTIAVEVIDSEKE